MAVNILREAVHVERRVGPRHQRALDILPSEPALPRNRPAVHDGRGQSRDAHLDPQRVQVAAEELVQRVLGVNRRTGQKGQRQNREGYGAADHQAASSAGTAPMIAQRRASRT